MGQTRVNLRHLLEDIRDSYPFAVHEAVITELVANALDSGAGGISIEVAFDPPRLVFADDGSGMGRRAFETYHDIASTSKVRGQGIGFAGVGAKLSLLLCREVVTETGHGGFRGATRWWLESANVAPWTEIESPGLLNGASGTAVALYPHRLDDPLLDTAEVARIIRDHFESLLDPDLSRYLFLYYPGGVRFTIDGMALTPAATAGGESLTGEVRRGRHKALGIAKLTVTETELDEERRGVGVSVLGKVVKRGWEWLGIAPEHPELVSGIVEVPSLVSLLTTNKADFLRDGASLQKFYKLRKQVQETISGLLSDLGELPGRKARPRDLRPVEREMGRVLDRLLDGFPELEPLLERRRGWEQAAAMVSAGQGEGGVDEAIAPEQSPLPGLEPGAGEGPEMPPTTGPETTADPSAEGDAGAAERAVRRRKPGLRLAWVDEPSRREEMSWLEGGVLALNRAHPAQARVRGPAAERLWAVTAIATALAHELGPGHNPLEFVSRFLAAWGDRGRPTESPAVE
ncbi:MAG: ATP-binding protein [Acidobacteria bacterium]|nr:ATP-binding protein [Acidobacteriota bacterium]